MRGEHNVWFLFPDFRHNLVNRSRGKRRIRRVAHTARFHHGFSGRDPTHLEYLAPAEREEPVANDQDPLASGKLAGNGLHRISTAAGDKGHCISVVDFFQRS